MATWLVTTFGIDPGFARGVLFVFTAAIFFAIVWAIVAFVRGLTSGRLGRAKRNRQPRLAVMDTTDIDHRRQLVLVRRDHVEHLLLIGGPVDVVVEENIIRNAVGDVHGRSTRVRKPNDDEEGETEASGDVEPPVAAPTPAVQAPARPATPARAPGNGAPLTARAPASAPAARPQPPAPADTGEARRWRPTPPAAGETAQPAARPAAPARPVPPKPVAARPPQPVRTPPPPRPPVRGANDDPSATPQQPARTGPTGELRTAAATAPAFVPHPSVSDARTEPADETRPPDGQPTPDQAPAEKAEAAPQTAAAHAAAPAAPSQPAPAPEPQPETAAESDAPAGDAAKGEDNLDLDDEMARLLRGVGDR